MKDVEVKDHERTDFRDEDDFLQTCYVCNKDIDLRYEHICILESRDMMLHDDAKDEWFVQPIQAVTIGYRHINCKI